MDICKHENESDPLMKEEIKHCFESDLPKIESDEHVNSIEIESFESSL